MTEHEGGQEELSADEAITQLQEYSERLKIARDAANLAQEYLLKNEIDSYVIKFSNAVVAIKSQNRIPPGLSPKNLLNSVEKFLRAYPKK